MWMYFLQDYAFHASLYPVIISIENHCSPSNQRCMAEHFVEIMGDVLCKDNLVEIEGRERLPSPTELQGKIILKGTSKRKEVNMHTIHRAFVHSCVVCVRVRLL